MLPQNSAVGDSEITPAHDKDHKIIFEIFCVVMQRRSEKCGQSEWDEPEGASHDHSSPTVSLSLCLQLLCDFSSTWWSEADTHPDLNNFIGILTHSAVGGVKQEDGGNFVIQLVVMVTVTQFQSGD